VSKREGVSIEIGGSGSSEGSRWEWRKSETAAAATEVARKGGRDLESEALEEH
jgi:hypothetical protein